MVTVTVTGDVFFLCEFLPFFRSNLWLGCVACSSRCLESEKVQVAAI